VCPEEEAIKNLKPGLFRGAGKPARGDLRGEGEIISIIKA